MEPLPGMAGLRSPQTLDRIRRVFIESLHLNVQGEDLADLEQLKEAAGLDSVAVLEFVAALEKEFDIRLEPEMLTIEVVGDLKQLAAYIDERSAQGRPPLESPA
ncbi:MAG TPA: acyl carrier protein [Bryobacteraceae bacterium]|nr:acyl carrier protein [Bryobacteraceae bacterium]